MQGLIYAISAYTIWGCFPLYFHYLSDVSAVEVLAHRIIWSLVTTALLALFVRRWGKLLSALKDKKLVAWLGLSSVLIAINWLVYIWAIGHHRVLEASLGYFITPVVSLILARILFKERLHTLQAWAGILAALAIMWELYSFGELPWVGLVLAVAFALYGVVRKHCKVDGLSGLSIETLWLMPFALAWISWQSFNAPHTLAFASSTSMTLLLLGSGALTALPLVLFAMATRRIDLSVVGFIMYINPTMQFLIGVFVLKEAYPPERMITFALIWFALILFMVGLWQLQKQKVRA